MNYTRIYAGEDGDTHFEDLDIKFTPIDFVPPAPLVDLSPVERAEQIGFLRVPAHWDAKAHVAPVKAYYIFISGQWEVTTSDGTMRLFGPGSILRTDDTEGNGHTTHMVSDTEALAAVIQLPD